MLARRTRLWLGGLGWAAVLAAGLWLRGRGLHEPELPMLAPIADFSLTDQDGHPFGTSELRGKVWIAGFAFTSCPSVCPMLTSQMSNLERRLERFGERLHLVTVTVDPENDTPDRLRAYALEHHANLARWSFLTGAPEQVRTTLSRGFMVHVGPRTAVRDGFDILHTARLMLVDENGRLRGTYSTDGPGLDGLSRDVERLLAD